VAASLNFAANVNRLSIKQPSHLGQALQCSLDRLHHARCVSLDDQVHALQGSSNKNNKTAPSGSGHVKAATRVLEEQELLCHP
jgi:hypothetical protein